MWIGSEFRFGSFTENVSVSIACPLLKLWQTAPVGFAVLNEMITLDVKAVYVPTR